MSVDTSVAPVATEPVISSLPGLTDEFKAHLKTPLHIGNVVIASRVLQSPLSGVTDKVFRRLVRRYAPQSMLYTEMVSAAELRHLQRLPEVMDIDPDERPISIQLFDRRPDFLAEAARKAVDQGADTIDINMGCPVNKITKNGGGSSLLREPDTAVKSLRPSALPLKSLSRSKPESAGRMMRSMPLSLLV